MAEDVLEQEHVLPTREVKLGKWFRPFENYDAIPYGHQTSNHFDKEVEFISPGFGNWGVALDWDQREYQDIKKMGQLKDEMVIVFMPGVEEIISPPKLIDFQKDIELRLMNLIVGMANKTDDQFEDLIDNPPPFWVTVRLPSGNQYWTRFPIGLEWFLGSKKYGGLYVPDTVNIMEQLEMRIDKAKSYLKAKS